MRILAKIVKFSLLNTITLLLVCFININSAYAENNSFAPGTLILTSNGNIPIEELHSGDRVVGYNFETHQEEINHVQDIREISSLSYYLINNQTKITGTNYVYIKIANNPIIERVGQVKITDKLFGQNHQDYGVNQIEQIVKPFKLYQIILEEKNSNFFTDHFLVYSGEKIPNNFKNNYRHIDCGIGAPYPNYRSRECMQIYSAFPGFLIALVIWLVGLILSVKIFDWLRHIYLKLFK